MDKEWWKEADKEISTIFNQFAGKTIEFSMGLSGTGVNGSLMYEMNQAAARRYSYLRFVAPGTQRDENSHEITRINVEISPDGDGKWRIGNRFFRG
jgi:hypothetical protein